jgi:type I restriction enzyme S subunit
MSRLVKDIPEHWEVHKLGNLGEFKNGINKGKDDFGFGTPFINLMDVFGKPVLKKDDWQLVNASKSEIQNYSLQKGDILFIRSSVKPSGVGLTSVIKEDVENTVYSGFLIRFRPRIKDIFDIDYLQYCFFESGFRKRLIDRSSTSANTNINQENLQVLTIVLPPLPEQQKIAAILSKWDELIETQTQLITTKEKQKTSLMQKLLTGEVRFPGFEDKWGKCSLRDISSLITKGTTPTSLGFNFETEGVNFIKAENINNFGEIEIESTPKISEECNVKLKRSQLEVNDIVFSIAGTLGRTAIIQEKDLPANTNQALAIIRLKDAEPHFVNFCLNTPNIEKYIKEMVSVGAQPNINLEQVNEIVIPVPSIKEQVKITEILYKMELEIKHLKTELKTIELQKKGLMQHLLTGKIRVKN